MDVTIFCETETAFSRSSARGLSRRLIRRLLVLSAAKEFAAVADGLNACKKRGCPVQGTASERTGGWRLFLTDFIPCLDELAVVGAEVLKGGAGGADGFGKHERGVLAERFADKFHALGVRGDVHDFIHVFGGNLRAVDEVDELVRKIRIRAVFQNRKVVEREGGAFFRDNEHDGGILGGNLKHVAAVGLDHIELSGGEGALGVVDFELGNLLFPDLDEFHSFVDLLLFSGVDVESERAEGDAEDFAQVVQQGGAVFEIGTFEHAPGRLEVLDFVLVVADSGEAGEVGDGVLELFVERILDVGLVNVFVDVRKLGVVKSEEHALTLHEFRHVGGWDDDVVAACTGFEFGIHRFVGVENVNFDFAVELLFKFFDDIVGDVVTPVVDVEYLLGLSAGDCEKSGEDHSGEEQSFLHFFGSNSFWLINTRMNVKIRNTTDRALMTAGVPRRIAL